MMGWERGEQLTNIKTQQKTEIDTQIWFDVWKIADLSCPI